jgi:hypothetical protein
MPIPEQDDQFSRGQLMTRLIAIGPPAQSSLREAFQNQIKSLTVINQQFQRRVAAVGKNEQSPQQWIFAQLLAAQSDQSIYAFPKIDGIDGKQNALRGTESEHRAPTSKSKRLACSHIPDRVVGLPYGSACRRAVPGPH